MIDPEIAEFVQGAVGIHVGTRNGRLEPNGARALAAVVDDTGSHLVVYLAKVAAERLLPDLHDNGQIAVSFGRPVDERACQVKGVFVGVRDALEDERERVGAHWERYLANLEEIGIARGGSNEWATWPCSAIRLRVTAVFEQSPRPGTGGRIA
jgi:hypothetical protein